MSDSIVKPYSEDGSKKQQVELMFDSIAHKYDWLNRLLSLRIDVLWRKQLIKIANSVKPTKVLDVATGTADVAIAMSNLNPTCHITGLDLSAGMLAMGQRKLDAQTLNNRIKLVQGDSEGLPFEDGTFDALTVAFGVRNYENLETGLLEMLRVIRKGGVVTILEFSQPTSFPFKQLYNFYFRNILPIVGKLTSKDPKAYTYLFESVQSFPYGTKFLDILTRCGYQNVRCKTLTLGICSIYVGYK